jgi:hypothetical protein
MSETATVLFDRMTGGRMLRDIADFARAEASLSNLPGWTNGPADAYRHLIVVGEMTRRFGTIPATLMAEYNETLSWYEMQRSRLAGKDVPPANQPEARTMDRHNNWNVAPAIGRAATTPEGVVLGARVAIERAIQKAGSGENNTAYWRPSAEWDNEGPSDNWPRPVWHDLTAQPHITTYRQQAGLPPQPQPVQAPAEAFKKAGGGPVEVRPHQRDGHPVQGYRRSAPSR